MLPSNTWWLLPFHYKNLEYKSNITFCWCQINLCHRIVNIYFVIIVTLFVCITTLCHRCLARVSNSNLIRIALYHISILWVRKFTQMSTLHHISITFCHRFITKVSTLYLSSVMMPPCIFCVRVLSAKHPIFSFTLCHRCITWVLNLHLIRITLSHISILCIREFTQVST